jgi:hypothetical protein
MRSEPVTSIILAVGTLLLPGTTGAADPPADFPSLLEQLEKAKTPEDRGFDQMPHSSRNAGKRVVQMLGSPQTWDPYGTPALRQAVIARWRKRWAAEGEAMLRGLRPAESSPGRVEVRAGGVHVVRDVVAMRNQFLLNNGRLYELGAMDGTFPPSGFMLGDQSGVWAPPIKALDGFAFVLSEAGSPAWRLDDCQHFAHDFASGTLHFAAHGWSLSRTDFPADDQPALFSRLTLTNRTAGDRSLDVDFVAEVNVRPDWRTAAQAKQQNDLDVMETRDGLVRAWDPNLPRSMVALGADRPATHAAVDGATAKLSYRLTVPAGRTVELNCLIQAGLDPNDPGWATAFRGLAARSQGEFDGRRKRDAARTEGGVRFACSDPRLTEAFLLAKANLGLLTADCRPHFPDVYLMAGVPVYPRLFACDACLSLPGATAAGFWPEARGTLACLAAQARKHGSLVPHESATDGTLIGPSNSQETTQFIAACADHLRWTRDPEFAAAVYPLLTDAMAAHRARFVKEANPDGYPDGPALIETRNSGGRKIDAACWQHAALAALAEVAQLLDKEDEAGKWRAEAARLQGAIRRGWWLPEQRMWADSLDADGRARSDGLWSVVFPLLTGVAGAEQSSLALDGLESGWLNQWGGVHTRQPDPRRQGSGVVTTGVFAQAALAHRRGDLGLRLLLLNAEAPRQERMPGAFTEMIPPGGSDFAQLWSAGPFLAAVVEGLAGVRPDAAAHQVEIAPQLPAGLDWLTLDHVRIGEHELRLDVRRAEKKVHSTVTHVRGRAPLVVSFLPSGKADAETLLDGKTAVPIVRRIDRLDREVRVVRCSLAAGKSAVLSE